MVRWFVIHVYANGNDGNGNISNYIINLDLDGRWDYLIEMDLRIRMRI